MAKRIKDLYTEADVGCYADGANGHDYVRSRLATMVRPYQAQLAEALNTTPSDDHWEEDEALEALNNEACEGDVYFTFDGGDLILTLGEDE